MTIYELMKVSRSLLDAMRTHGIRVEDCSYLPIFEEYDTMKKQGEKITYIVTYLSEKHNISERTLYRMITNFTKEVKI